MRLWPNESSSEGGTYHDPEWYTSQEEDENPWSENPKLARLFTSIHDAHRVARGGSGYAVAVVDSVDLSMYRRN
jgi:hypothetical protein